MINRSYKWRLAFIVFVVTGAFAGLGARLTYLHLSPNERFQERITRVRQTERVIPAERGRITDRRGQTLAMDLAVKDVWIDPTRIQADGHGEFIAAHLARILQIDPAFILQRIAREGREYEPIKRRVHQDVANEVARLPFRGVHFDDVMTRYYAQGSLMCHVLGFTNMEGVGSAGVEQRYNSLLRGIPGYRVSERDGRRSEMYHRRQLDIAPRRGSDIQLTLDQNLQYLLESELDKGLEQFGGQAAWGIMMRVRTGEILAMASRPAYDLNAFRESSLEQRRNRAISYNYEPGSTFKVAVIAAAFNEGLIAPSDIIDCENGVWHFRGRPLRDYRPHGRLTVADVLQKSSNIGSAKIALMMSEARLEKYLREFGFGRSTGIDLPGEEGGILASRSQWSGISVTRIAMGHEVAVTALQLLNSVNAIANNGYLMQPYVVKRITDQDGQLIREGEPRVLSRPIREDTARLMSELMARVTDEGGTARAARMDGYRVAGKTGTAQKPVPGGYSDRLNIASFVGFLPAENPEISMVIVVDEPWPIRTGGAVAAPIFKAVAEQAVRYLDIPQTITAQNPGRLAAP